VYLGALDAGPFDPAVPAELAARLEAACGAVLELVQQLARDDLANPVGKPTSAPATSIDLPGARKTET
jgi:hypothetical protein